MQRKAQTCSRSWHNIQRSCRTISGSACNDLIDARCGDVFTWNGNILSEVDHSLDHMAWPEKIKRCFTLTFDGYDKRTTRRDGGGSLQGGLLRRHREGREEDRD